MTSSDSPQFHWADYLVLACSLAIGIIIGITFAIRDKWLHQSTESYLMADRSMNWILVGLSFWATVVSAGFFIGLTTDFYYFGLTIVWVIVARYIGGAFTMLVVIPKFYRMGFTITSAYEYFERRFHLAVRIAVGCMFIVISMLGMAVTLYGPSLLLSKVSGISLEWSIVLGGGTCLIYSAFGGMKAVIWVDSVQILIMTAGMCVLAGYGVVKAGGMGRVWQLYSELGERDNWRDLDPSPWNRHTLWNVVFLQGFTYAGLFSTGQSVLQRYMTVPTMRMSQWAVFLGITVGVGFTAIVAIGAMAAFATVGGNDPLLNGKLQRPDQILPFFLMHLLGDFHGLPGLVLAAIFSAALSTLSSGQNALAAVITTDFAQTIYWRCTRRKLKDKSAGLISRITGIVAGVAAIALGLIVPYFNDTLISLSLSVSSLLSGPILGLLIVGFFFFWVESCGALVGLLSSLAWGLMMFLGAQRHSHKIGRERRPLFNRNFTEIIYFSDPDVKPNLFDVSYTWYVFLDVMIVLIVSTVISLIIHCIRNAGCLKRSTMFSDRNLRYTMDDLRAAVGCNKRKDSSEHDHGVVPYETDLATTESNGYAEHNTKQAGIANIAYQEDRL